MSDDEHRLNEADRLAILDRMARLVSERLYDPNLNGVDWRAAVEEARDGIAKADDSAEFERRVNELLKVLKVSHLGFFHERGRNATGKQTIGVTFMEDKTLDPPRWVFEDVHELGPAARAGIQRGWTLIAATDDEAIPPMQPAFRFDASNSVEALDRELRPRSVVIEVPKPKNHAKPFAEFPPVSARRLDGGTALLKVSHFPGVVGIDVANAISVAIRELNPERLIIDLRGNTGGGLGCIRLMSLLVPDRRPIGYSLTRKAFGQQVNPERLPRFNRIPGNRLECLPLFPRFALRDKSVLLETEGLGNQRFHGAVAILVNQHSASATEMVAAFASETKSAILAGTKTPGRVTGAKSFALLHGYHCAIPVAAYRTWAGTNLEGVGVSPDIHSPVDATALRSGRDGAVTVAEELIRTRCGNPMVIE